MSTASQPPSAAESLTLLLEERTTDEKREKLFRNIVAMPMDAPRLCECAGILRRKMVAIDLPGNPIDTCGTGGSGQKTINTSTLTALVVAAAGGKIAKHGNRSASGNCGCFDLLESLGVRIDLTPDEERRIFETLGIVFLFAPRHHPTLRFVAPLRKRHGRKTFFNLIGPLCNPANVRRQLLGTGQDDHAAMMAEALQLLGTERSMVVTGGDGLDEVTVTRETAVRTVSPAGIEHCVFAPEDLGIPRHAPESIEGGAPDRNKAIFLELAAGRGEDAHRDLVLVNAAHALLLAGLTPTLHDAFSLGTKTLASGAVLRIFERYRNLTQTL